MKSFLSFISEANRKKGTIVGQFYGDERGFAPVDALIRGTQTSKRHEEKKVVSESHTKEEIKNTSTKELRKLANVYSKKVSVIRQQAIDAKESGEHDKAKKLHAQADDHQDEEMDIRQEIRDRLGLK